MVAGRESVGYELESDFADVFGDRCDTASELSRRKANDRIDDHREFVADHDSEFGYDAENYDFNVKTSQEQDIQFYEVADVEAETVGHDGSRFVVTHEPFEESDE
jgi:hypothetical protein